MTKEPKTVYVLGAGFSKDAGYPLQARILPKLQALRKAPRLDPSSRESRARSSSQEIRKRYQGLIRACSFPSVDELLRERPRLCLEDIFTFLDQSIERRDSYREFTWIDLEEHRISFNAAILSVFHLCGESKTDTTFYERLAASMIFRRISAGRAGDPFAIVSVNWDSLIEDSIYACISRAHVEGEIDVDYGCFSNALGTSPHTPSITQKAKGMFNVKCFKLHGSVNWLLCPACNRLFSGLGSDEKEWELYALKRACSVCESLRPPESPGKTPQLEPFFVTPTYVKQFNNPHIQMVWHNAYIELAEAQKIVFIGYSLPPSDYHVRTLLLRALNPSADIVVVSHGRKDLRNYKSFFGSREITWQTEGVQAYFDNIVKQHSLRGWIQKVRNAALAARPVSA